MKRIVQLISFFIVISITQQASAGWFDWWRSDYTKTRYPIVLAHGFLGFDSVLILDYWPGIVRTLERDGAEVFVTVVSTVNGSEARGEQLLAQVEEILAITGAEKVNIIGHSQGSLDARYVAAVRPDLVASVTSVGGPHGDTGLGGVAGNDFFNTLLAGLGELIALLSGNDQPIDAEAAARIFSAEGINEFNQKYPAALPNSPCGEGDRINFIDGNPVHFYSWGGTSLTTNILDPSDLLMFGFGITMGEPNDGLVSRCNNHLGDVIRDNYRMNHLDLTNMLLGLVSWFEVNPKSVYRTHANRLKRAGL